MSWIERAVEERLAKAAAAGELDTPHLHGTQLDLDTSRSQGWWAEQLLRRERSHDRRQDALTSAATARAAFWRVGEENELREQVAEANRAIDDANAGLVETDRLECFDVDDIVARWRRLRR